MLPDGQELSLSGQTLLSMGHPSTPSTVIESPSGSTRPFSSPSPALSPSETSLSHQSSMNPSLTTLSQSTHSIHSQLSSLDSYGNGRTDQGMIPLNFQELY